MMKTGWKAALAALSLSLAACGNPAPESKAVEAQTADPHAHEEKEHAEEETPYEEGKGLSLNEESRRALGVSFAHAERRSLRAERTLTAQIYRAAAEPSSRSGRERTGSAYATAWVDPATSHFRAGERARVGEVEGVVWRIADASRAATGKEEVLLEIPDAAGRLAVGDFVPVRVEREDAPPPVLAVPDSAVLYAAAGTSAYVERDGRLLRVPIAVGESADGWIEIKDGLAEGDTVASSGAESLYLVELRFTKGGGHAH